MKNYELECGALEFLEQSRASATFVEIENRIRETSIDRTPTIL
jgi:hypothetical protein